MLLMVLQMDTSGDSLKSWMRCDTSPNLGGSTDGVHLYMGAGSTVGQKISGLEHLLE